MIVITVSGRGQAILARQHLSRPESDNTASAMVFFLNLK